MVTLVGLLSALAALIVLGILAAGVANRPECARTEARDVTYPPQTRQEDVCVAFKKK